MEQYVELSTEMRQAISAGSFGNRKVQKTNHCRDCRRPVSKPHAEGCSNRKGAR